MAGHQYLGYGAFQKICVQFRHTFEGGEEPSETVCFIFFIPQRSILLRRKLEDQPFGVVLVDWLLLQSVIQRLLRFNMYNGTYRDFTKVSVEKFLRADVNATKAVDHTDAVAIVNQFK